MVLRKKPSTYRAPSDTTAEASVEPRPIFFGGAGMISTLEHLATANSLLSSRDIAARCATSYKRALKLACKITPGRSQDLERFESLTVADQLFFLRMTGVRSAIDGAYVDGDRHQAGADWRRSIRASLQAFEQAANDLDFFRRWRAAGADFDRILCPDYPYIVSVFDGRPTDGMWSECHDLRILFQRHMQDSVGAFRCQPTQVTDIEFERIDRSLIYFDDLSRSASDDILYNVRFIVKIDYEDTSKIGQDCYREIGQSVSTHSVPSACFLSPYALSFDEICAESIYHEALHKKLSNTLVAYEILSPEFDWQKLPKFLSHWNVDTQWNRNDWEFDRAIYALHVYTHLGAMYRQLLDAKDFRFFSEKWCRERFPTCAQRAYWLYEWISSLDNIFLEAGRALIADWGDAIRRIKRVET